MGWLARSALALCLMGCGGSAAVDAGVAGDAGLDAMTPGIDAGARDGGGPVRLPDAGARDGAMGSDASTDATLADAAIDRDALGAHRDRLLATLGAPCATWAALGESARAVFLMITHRLFVSTLPDGSPALAHVTRVYLVLGGGSDGSECGGAENNRLFVQMDDDLWARMVETWEGSGAIDDGAGATWIHTRDLAGPHDPFDASNETSTGLACALLFETSDSRPPTAQAHFFLDGSEAPVERGSGISLPSDPRMLEIDLDFDCIHRSNPTCADFEARYRRNWGDFGCEWTPSSCVPTSTGCYRDVTP